jgi:formamidopyrimidine-DNA glycosylase
VPELPEAETIVRTLAPHVEGRSIQELRFLGARASRGAIPPLAGRIVRRVRRYGKQVVLELDGGLLAIELRMTGSLRWRGAAGPYTRAVIGLDRGWISFDDIRQFGSIRWLSAPPNDLGPDPLAIDENEFIERLRGRAAQVKRLLLDQRFLRGIGNIYADEILFRAGIHPCTPASRLSAERARRLRQAMADVLRRAIAAGGSSISDYVDANGRPGEFQNSHQVYGRQSRPCPRCGRPVRRIVAAQRGTHYCPVCQKY